jgi:hypothetical protein
MYFSNLVEPYDCQHHGGAGGAPFGALGGGGICASAFWECAAKPNASKAGVV